MEQDIHSKFKKLREEHKLSDAEKVFHRAEIIKFIEKRPSPYVSEKKISFFHFGFMFRRHLVLASLAAIFFVGSGVAMSANGSLPNELLYNVKTKINEPIALFLTPTSQGKATMKVAFVNRRLQEFSMVTLNNKKLKPKDKVNFVNRLSLQIKDTQKNILQLAEESNTSGAFHANNNLQSILVNQDIIIDKIHTANPGAEDTNEFTSMINTSIEETAQIEDQITNSVNAHDNETKIDQTILNIKKEVDASLKNLEAAKENLEKQDLNRLDVIDRDSLDTKITDIHEDLELAEKEMDEGNKQEALRLYNKLDRDLGKLNSLIQAKKQLKIQPKN
jgi:hypothetical protein